MFDKLEDILFRYDEVLKELSEPEVLNDASRYQKLMKEQSDLEPIVEKYREYKETKAGIEDSLAMLEEETDEAMSAKGKLTTLRMNFAFCFCQRTRMMIKT